MVYDKAVKKLAIIANNMRSAHNVGSLLRTADGLGALVYLTGYTPYPPMQNDPRLPHEQERIRKQIHKTALGAEMKQLWRYYPDITSLIRQLRTKGYSIAALEQSSKSTPLPAYTVPEKCAILLGNEIHGVDQIILETVDVCIEIPMFGSKESFNVVQAAAMALYHCRFSSQTMV
jgi:23S rRNA (guanosine2251-2'-O)-methyltransferase